MTFSKAFGALFIFTEKLIITFDNLGFNVQAHDDVTDTGMLQVISQMALEDHTSYDCFVCCILTHGLQGELYGVNGITVPIKDLTGPMRAQSCPTLSGKPKLFFLQACQGRDKQPGNTKKKKKPKDIPLFTPGKNWFYVTF